MKKSPVQKMTIGGAPVVPAALLEDKHPATKTAFPVGYGNRFPIMRMKRLATLLRYSLPFTCNEVAAELETCRKTIVRDITFMRDRLGWDIEYDAHAGKYKCLSAPTPAL